ncbi:sigma-54 interaction domain-containing protein [Oceanobacillus senegalensis]|uniref:sigma-54 interaction domain-containing protein n=1 Tax=Oceanobacillus senegalensis TaxID=1936063 RepID=UPI000A3117DD|nr:sigma 54-interacting transcriptional regulator [Oceanobacillus senegalensis]
MLFHQIPFNRNTYVSIEDMKSAKSAMNKFFMNNTWFLPAVENGSLVGIVNGYKLIKDSEKDQSNDSCIQTNIVKAYINDKVDSYLNLKQQILPIVSKNESYIGYVEVKRLQDIERLGNELYNVSQRYHDLEEEYNIVLKSSKDVIHIIDDKGVTLRISDSCETIDGIKRQEVIDRNLQEMVEDLVYSKSVALEVIEKSKSITIVQKVHNGKEIIATGTPFFKNGKLFRVIVNARDITELNALKNEFKEVQQMKKELQLFRSEQMKLNDIIVSSKKLQEVYKLASRVASVDSTVLIYGESGVGKGVLSKFIHQHSNRVKQPFIKIDVSAIPEALLESELFGYEKGAFTGADTKGKTGLVELANKGTLFLDEIGELPINLQSKILRLFQDKVFFKVGGKKPIHVNIRIIAATNQNLEEMVKKKMFRQDLYYRLNVIPLRIPPLREHQEDVQPIIFHHLNKINKKYNCKKKISTVAMDCLLQYHWPGNIRELENMIERLIVLSEGDIIQKHELPEKILNAKNHSHTLNEDSQIQDMSYKTIMNNHERKLLLSIKSNSSSVKDMAIKLKLDPSTVRRKLNKHKINLNF